MTATPPPEPLHAGRRHPLTRRARSGFLVKISEKIDGDEERDVHSTKAAPAGLNTRAKELLSRVLSLFIYVDKDKSGDISHDELLNFIHEKTLDHWKNGDHQDANTFDKVPQLPENIGKLVEQEMSRWDLNCDGSLDFSGFTNLVLHSDLFLAAAVDNEARLKAEILMWVESNNTSVVRGRLVKAENYHGVRPE